MKIRLHTPVTNNGENIAVIGEPLGPGKTLQKIERQTWSA